MKMVQNPAVHREHVFKLAAFTCRQVRTDSAENCAEIWALIYLSRDYNWSLEMIRNIKNLQSIVTAQNTLKIKSNEIKCQHKDMFFVDIQLTCFNRLPI